MTERYLTHNECESIYNALLHIADNLDEIADHLLRESPDDERKLDDEILTRVERIRTRAAGRRNLAMMLIRYPVRVDALILFPEQL